MVVRNLSRLVCCLVCWFMNRMFVVPFAERVECLSGEFKWAANLHLWSSWLRFVVCYPVQLNATWVRLPADVGTNQKGSNRKLTYYVRTWHCKWEQIRSEVELNLEYRCTEKGRKPGSSVQPFETQARSGLFGGELKWLVALYSTPDKYCWVFRPSQEIADLFSLSWQVEEFVWVPDR